MTDEQLKQALKELDALLADAADTIEVLAGAEPNVPAAILEEAADVERRLRARSSEITDQIFDLVMRQIAHAGPEAD